jgi:hypothetical protein
MTSGGITSPARRAHGIMNRDVPDEKEPRKAPKIFVTAFYARSGPSWISFGKLSDGPIRTRFCGGADPMDSAGSTWDCCGRKISLFANGCLELFVIFGIL